MNQASISYFEMLMPHSIPQNATVAIASNLFLTSIPKVIAQRDPSAMGTKTFQSFAKGKGKFHQCNLERLEDSG